MVAAHERSRRGAQRGWERLMMMEEAMVSLANQLANP